MNKKAIIFIIIGTFFIIIPFFFNTYNIIRLISVLLGIVLITISLIFKENKNIYLIIIVPLILIVLTYSLDVLLYVELSKIPIYIYELKSNDKISTYNSFFYRIYNCENELVLDYGYEKRYACSVDSLEEIDINTFLINPLESYQENKNKFVKISGKVSKISGRDNMELNAYTLVDDSLNGYVNFSQDYKVSISLDEDLSGFRIYDYVSVVGRVARYENGTIFLEDAYTISSDIYNEYDYEIEENDSTDLVNLTGNYYLYGISSFHISYAPDAIYELSYLITDGRISIEDIVNDTGGEILRNDELVTVAKKYDLNDFNALVCENEKIILANKNYDLNIDLCN